MYIFKDKADRSIALRPEGTASVVRAYIENHLYPLPSPQKYYSSGPMFRYERPQSGRFSQFYQIGVEVFGSSHPLMDAEVISLLRHFLHRLGFSGLEFQVNSIGCTECRPGFREALKGFFSDKRKSLCPDCLRRYDHNPLRILDCKVKGCIEIRSRAPKVTESLCSACRDHFDELLTLMKQLDIPFSVTPDMVRGLDYYTRTTFEVTSELLGAQNAVAAGGRYDRLVHAFGGPDVPAVGFAVGMERIISLLKKADEHDIPVPHLFLALMGTRAGKEGIVIADRLRSMGVWVELGDHESSLKSQMRRADRLSAEYVIVIGDDEIIRQRLKWKKLSDSSQGEIGLSEISEFFLKSV
jgi:histidyl-tRNA synthetase